MDLICLVCFGFGDVDTDAVLSFLLEKKSLMPVTNFFFGGAIGAFCLMEVSACRDRSIPRKLVTYLDICFLQFLLKLFLSMTRESLVLRIIFVIVLLNLATSHRRTIEDSTVLLIVLSPNFSA